jgi:hypothetical protein
MREAAPRVNPIGRNRSRVESDKRIVPENSGNGRRVNISAETTWKGREGGNVSTLFNRK